MNAIVPVPTEHVRADEVELLSTDRDLEQRLELAHAANEAHEQCCRHLGTALRYALQAGEALCALRESVPAPDWRKWSSEHLEISPASISRYQRLWSYREMLPATVATVSGGLKAIEGMPALTNGKLPSSDGAPPGLIDRVCTLHEQGYGYKAISAMTGVAVSTARSWVDPAAAAKSRRRSQDIALAKKEDKKLAAADARRRARNADFNAAGGEIAAAYRSLRNATVLTELLRDRASAGPAVGLQKVLMCLNKAEELLHAVACDPTAPK